MIRKEFSAPFLREELFNERVQIFTEFRDSQRSANDGMEYKNKIRSMIRRGETKLIVNIDVRNFNINCSVELFVNPMEYLDSFDKALKVMITSFNETNLPFENLAKIFFHVELDGAFGEYHTDQRKLTSRYLSHTVCIDGIITSYFLVRPKLVKSVHYVEKGGIIVTREYRDVTMSSNYIPLPKAYPTEDSEGNPLSTEYGYCLYK